VTATDGAGSNTADAAAAAHAAAAVPAPLRVLLVDDEPLARLRLRQLLALRAEGLPALQVVGEADSAAALAALLDSGMACDLVLLDIALPGRSGLDIAQALRQRPLQPAVVFVTAHGDHALRAFELDAVDYLTKPVRRERLLAALQRVQRWRAAGALLAGAAEAAAGPAAPVLVVSDRGRVLRVPVGEVLSLKAGQKYVQLVSRHGQWWLDDALTDLEQRLGAAVLRVHRNALVAVAAVRALERVGGQATDDAAAQPEQWVVLLEDGQRLAVSRRQLPAVREALAQRG
jgi:two-component system response regulator AlgR